MGAVSVMRGSQARIAHVRFRPNVSTTAAVTECAPREACAPATPVSKVSIAHSRAQSACVRLAAAVVGSAARAPSAFVSQDL